MKAERSRRRRNFVHRQIYKISTGGDTAPSPPKHKHHDVTSTFAFLLPFPLPIEQCSLFVYVTIITVCIPCLVRKPTSRLNVLPIRLSEVPKTATPSPYKHRRHPTTYATIFGPFLTDGAASHLDICKRRSCLCLPKAISRITRKRQICENLDGTETAIHSRAPVPHFHSR